MYFTPLVMMAIICGGIGGAAGGFVAGYWAGGGPGMITLHLTDKQLAELKKPPVRRRSKESLAVIPCPDEPAVSTYIA